jgi:flagellin
MQISNTSTDTVSLSNQAFLDIGTSGLAGVALANTGTVSGVTVADDISLNAAITAGAITSDTAATATAAFQKVQLAANAYVVELGKQRSLLGAYQNQMEYTLSNVTELSSNLQSARSRVIDTDYASETASLTKGQILQQAATAMLAQANQMPNVILTLLK